MTGRDTPRLLVNRVATREFERGGGGVVFVAGRVAIGGTARRDVTCLDQSFPLLIFFTLCAVRCASRLSPVHRDKHTCTSSALVCPVLVDPVKL